MHTWEQERAWQRYRETRSPAAREELYHLNLGLVGYCIGRLRIPESDREDCYQEGCLELWEVIDRYDPTRKTQFSGFATRHIIGAILDYRRRICPLPRSAQEELQAGTCVDPSRQMPMSLEQCERGEDPVSDRIADPRVDVESEVVKQGETDDLLSLLEWLPAEERYVMSARLLGTTQKEIAKRIRKSHGRVSQIEQRAIQRLRGMIKTRNKACAFREEMV